MQDAYDLLEEVASHSPDRQPPATDAVGSRAPGGLQLARLLVEQVGDLVRPVGEHDAVLRLQRWRQLPRLLGQEARQERDPARTLVDGEAIERALDLRVEEAIDLLLLDQLLRRHLGQAVLRGPRPELVEVGRDEGAGVGLAVAEDHGLRHVARRRQRGLHRCRRHVLPVAENDEVLQPIGDLDPADVVELTDVAGVEPAIGVDRERRLLGRVQVALHDLRAADEDLPRLRRRSSPPSRGPGARPSRTRSRSGG